MAVAVIAVALLAVVYLLQREADPAADSTQQQGQDAEAQDSDDDGVPEAILEAERRDPEDPLAAGPVDAPVVLVVFSDYQCPYCQQWSQQTLPELLERADDGQVRIEWRDVNTFGDDSRRAASAAYAAGLQDSFWEYHHALFEDRAGSLSEDDLVELAAELDLDEDAFRQDLNAENTAQEIERNEQLGLGLGAMTTPSFLFNRSFYVGIQPTEVFVEVLDASSAG